MLVPREGPYCEPIRKRICLTTRSELESFRIDPLGLQRYAKIQQFSRGKLSPVYDKRVHAYRIVISHHLLEERRVFINPLFPCSLLTIRIRCLFLQSANKDECYQFHSCLFEQYLVLHQLEQCRQPSLAKSIRGFVKPLTSHIISFSAVTGLSLIQERASLKKVTRWA